MNSDKYFLENEIIKSPELLLKKTINMFKNQLNPLNEIIYESRSFKNNFGNNFRRLNKTGIKIQDIKEYNKFYPISYNIGKFKLENKLPKYWFFIDGNFKVSLHKKIYASFFFKPPYPNFLNKEIFEFDGNNLSKLEIYSTLFEYLFNKKYKNIDLALLIDRQTDQIICSSKPKSNIFEKLKVPYFSTYYEKKISEEINRFSQIKNYSIIDSQNLFNTVFEFMLNYENHDNFNYNNISYIKNNSKL